MGDSAVFFIIFFYFYFIIIFISVPFLFRFCSVADRSVLAGWLYSSISLLASVGRYLWERHMMGALLHRYAPTW